MSFGVGVKDKGKPCTQAGALPKSSCKKVGQTFRTFCICSVHFSEGQTRGAMCRRVKLSSAAGEFMVHLGVLLQTLLDVNYCFPVFCF